MCLVKNDFILSKCKSSGEKVEKSGVKRKFNGNAFGLNVNIIVFSFHLTLFMYVIYVKT